MARLEIEKLFLGTISYELESFFLKASVHLQTYSGFHWSESGNKFAYFSADQII